MSLDSLLSQWTEATAELPWGVANAFHDVFTLAQEEKTNLVYNADYTDNGACLVNQAASMLASLNGVGGRGKPMQHFHEVVSLFDKINQELFNREVNTEYGKVSALAADIFLHHFCPLKSVEEVEADFKQHDKAPDVYIEPTDDAMAEAVEKMLTTDRTLPCDDPWFEPVFSQMVDEASGNYPPAP